MSYSLTLQDSSIGERVEICSLTDDRFVRAFLLLGLLDGVVATVRSVGSDGSVLLDVDGELARIPAILARSVECRRA